MAVKDEELARLTELESSTKQDMNMAHRKNVILKQQLNAKDVELKSTISAMDILVRDGAMFQEERKTLLLKCREIEAHATKRVSVLEGEVKAGRALIIKLKMDMKETTVAEDKGGGSFILNVIFNSKIWHKF